MYKVMKIYDKNYIWTVLLFILLILKITTISAKNCESIIKQKDVLFKQQFEKENFCFWYKMEKEYTQVNITILINICTKNNVIINKLNNENYTVYHNNNIWSNTDEYIRISLYDIIDDISKIQYIDEIKIVSNATIELIKCKNCKLQSFPSIKKKTNDVLIVVSGILMMLHCVIELMIYINT